MESLFLKPHTVLATAKFTPFTFLLKNEDAYFKERRRIKTKTQQKKKENAKKKRKRKKKNQKKKKTHKNGDAKEGISVGALCKSLQIINSSIIYKKYLDCLWK